MCNTKQLHDIIRYINQLRLQFYVVLTKLSTYLITITVITSLAYGGNLAYNCVHTNYIVADVVSDAYTLRTSNKHVDRLKIACSDVEHITDMIIEFSLYLFYIVALVCIYTKT